MGKILRPKLPTIRSSLLRLHRTILLIDSNRWDVDASRPLSDVEIMVLLLEDRRFFDHIGFDWLSIVRELVRAICLKNHGGASTIDMQLFRTASNRYERTLRRKIREILGVIVMQRKFTKIEILRIYLNIAYFGTGIRGIDSAIKSVLSTEEFDHYQENLEMNLNQAATVASLLVYPKPRIVNTNWLSKVRRRANYGLTLYPGGKKRFNKIFS